MKNFLFFSILLPPFSILTAQTFSGSTGIVHDVQTNTFSAIVSGLSPANIDTNTFGLESVRINLTHTWDSDLDIRIIAPDGTQGMLSSGNGGSGDDYTNTVFTDTASTNIGNGNSPFTGYFKPQGQMGLVNNNQNGNGTWILQVTDMAAQDSGMVLSWSITFGNNPATYFSLSSSNLPIVIINTLNSQSIPDSPKIQADMGIIYNGFGVRNYMTDPWNNYNGRIGIELRGSSSQMFPKKSYGLELWDTMNWPHNAPLINMPSENDWALIANYSDKSLMNNKLSYDLSREMGWWAPRAENVEVVLNGEYQGVYLLVEKIKRDSNRVNIAPMTITNTSGDALTGGYIIKIDKGTGTGGGGWTSPFAPASATSGQTIFFQYDTPSDVTINIPQQAYIQAYVDSFETALAGPNFANPNTGYAKYIDVNSFIDYFFVNEMSHNVDGYRLSTYLFKDRYSRGGKLVMGPVWDYDISWGNANYCNGNNTAGWAYQFGNYCSGDYWQIPFWWDRLMQDPAFRDKVRCRWEELSQTILSPTYLHNYCDSMALYLNESEQRNFFVWPTLGTYVWPNPSPIPTTYQGEVDELKNFITGRYTWLDANMPGTLNGCNVAGVNENSSGNSDAAFPNPFTGTVNLSIYLRDPAPVHMELYNSLGQLVQPEVVLQHNGGTQTLVFKTEEDLPAGMYLLRIRTGNLVWTQELSKAE
ncbi:MAG: CotH kinase family protein [Bacteroidetes bacterium]|nr:CotH kinase family protein [Bacteroidota bacterium]